MLNQEPERARHSGTMASIINTKAMLLHVPFAVIPSKNNITVVNKIDFEKIIAALIGKSAR